MKSKKEPIIDLHTHTNVSDGILSPKELVEAAVKSQIDIMAVTDHDCIDATDEVLDLSKSLPIKIIPGIEISSHIEDFEVHILGYNIDYKSANFIEKIDELCRSRIDRIYKICDKLRKLGLKIEADEIFSIAKCKSICRTHVARVLLSKGYVHSINQAFRRYLSHRASAYVPPHEFTTKDAVDLIKSVGGIPVIAHPSQIGDDAIIPSIVGDGVMGIEVFHCYKSSSTENYLNIAKKYKLLVTGGSDYHGIKSDVFGNLGEFNLPYEYFQEFEKYLNYSK